MMGLVSSWDHPNDGGVYTIRFDDSPFTSLEIPDFSDDGGKHIREKKK